MAEIKERDKSKKRGAIMGAAERVFISAGYEQASMDTISEEAGVSKRTVYNHFGSKEKLFEAMILELLEDRRVPDVYTYDAKRPLRDQLRAFADAEIHTIDSKRRLELSRFLTITFLKDLSFQKLMYGKFPSVYAMLADWLAAAKADGRIAAENVPLAARVFYSMVIGAVTWPALFTEGIDRKAVDPMLEELITVFLARYGASPESPPDTDVAPR